MIWTIPTITHARTPNHPQQPIPHQSKTHPQTQPHNPTHFLSPPKTHCRTHSAEKPSSPNTKTQTWRRAKSLVQAERKDPIYEAVTPCSTKIVKISDFQFQKTLKPLLNLKKSGKSLEVHPWWSPSSARLADELRESGTSWIRLSKSMRV